MTFKEYFQPKADAFHPIPNKGSFEIYENVMRIISDVIDYERWNSLLFIGSRVEVSEKRGYHAKICCEHRRWGNRDIDEWIIEIRVLYKSKCRVTLKRSSSGELSDPYEERSITFRLKAGHDAYYSFRLLFKEELGLGSIDREYYENVERAWNRILERDLSSDD